MLDYEGFKDEILNRLKIEFGDDKVEIVEAIKTNDTKMEAVKIDLEADKDLSPMVYLEDLYRYYKDEDASIYDCVDRIISAKYESPVDNDIDALREMVCDYDLAKDHIYPMLINTEDNKELLKKLVSFEFLDLSEIFIIRGDGMESGYSIKISDELLTKYGVSAEDLREQAHLNMENDGYHLMDIEDMIRNMINESDICVSEDIEIFEAGKLYVLSNRKNFFGASAMLYSDFLKKKLKDMSAYIIPSSIHEVLIFPLGDNVDKQQITETIRTVNDTALKPTEILSDHLYLYDASTETVKVA